MGRGNGHEERENENGNKRRIANEAIDRGRVQVGFFPHFSFFLFPVLVILFPVLSYV